MIAAYYPPYGDATTVRPWPTDELLDRVGLAGHARHRIVEVRAASLEDGCLDLVRRAEGEQTRHPVPTSVVGAP